MTAPAAGAAAAATRGAPASSPLVEEDAANAVAGGDDAESVRRVALEGLPCSTV